jgi:type II secretory pathway pseudopilin PulG
MISGAFVVLVLLLAPYVRPWITQRSQISDGTRQVQELQREVSALQDERRRWDDPAYVKAQARERLHFVMPGETGYVILDDSSKPAAVSDPRSVTAAMPGTNSDQPWYARVWQSVRIAGDPTTEQARTVDGR